jgi:hypothetical protein
VSRQGMYRLSVRIEPEAFFNLPPERLAAALVAEGIPVRATYPVLYLSELWRSGLQSRRWDAGVDRHRRLGLGADCPVSERISSREGLAINHEVFLGDSRDIHDVVEAFDKVQRHAAELRDYPAQGPALHSGASR